MTDITIQELTCFIRIHQEGGFRAAGRAIGRTQASVSQCLGRLERKPRAHLVRRGTREVKSCLTDKGEALLPLAIQLVALCDTYGLQSLDYFGCLVAIVEKGCQARAAAALFTTSPNINHKLRHMRRHTGLQIFRHNTSQLLEDGIPLYRAGLEVVALLRDIEALFPHQPHTIASAIAPILRTA